MKIPDSVSQKIFQYLQAQNTNMLLEGDVFTGRVISVDGDFLLMQLFDGREISAQINSDATYNTGDILKLKVIDRQQGRLITTEIEHNAVQENSTTEKVNNPIDILKSMNLPISKDSVEIFSIISDMGFKPTAQLIENALNIIEKMPVDDPRHAVFLLLNGIEDKEQYYKLVAEIDEGKFHFAEELDNLIKMLDASDDKNLSKFSENIKSTFENSLIKSSSTQYKALQTQSSKLNNEIAKPEDIAVPKVEQWISNLEKELASISKYIANSTSSNKEKILVTVNKLETAIQFFNELTGFEMFVQMPLLLKQKQTNGELYIMKRKGKKGSINSRDFSFFLSLSTENIGNLDIFVHVKNKNVKVKVSAENEKFKQLIISEYKTLYDALKEKGYYLYDLGFELKDEKVSVFNAEKKALMLSDNQAKKIDIKV